MPMISIRASAAGGRQVLVVDDRLGLLSGPEHVFKEQSAS